MILRTLRHLHSRQVWGRITSRMRQRIALWRGDTAARCEQVGQPLKVRPPLGSSGSSGALRDRCKVTLLNTPRTLGWPPDWDPPDTPLLWRFHLHYLGWLASLSPEERLGMARAWVEGNPPAPGPAWHPYPTSLRIANLLRMGIDDPVVTRSLYRQAAFLHRCVEYHVMGNHLLENARALIMAGTAFRGQGEADEWLKHGLAIYRDELPEQILPDGGHKERSPMYHALVLEGLLDAVNALSAADEAHPELPFLQTTARRMTAAGKAWLMPDGQIPLLNDSTFEIACPPDKLLQYAEELLGPVEPAGDAFPESGYFVHRGPRLHLFWDAGPGGPDHLMAHAHADVFSFELAVDGLRFVIDPGVYEYERGEDRDFVRSTRAHSTVEVDGRDQFECWHSFRVARRSQPRAVRAETRDGTSRFEGEYPWGEVYGGDVVHRRVLEVDDPGGLVRIRDRVTGSGHHRVRAHLPLHPEVEVRRTDDVFRLTRDGVSVDVHLSGSRIWVEARWVAPEFGLKVPNQVLVLAYEGTLPVEFDTELHLLS